MDQNNKKSGQSGDKRVKSNAGHVSFCQLSVDFYYESNEMIEGLELLFDSYLKNRKTL
jgi:hypothetical protein